MLKVARKKRFAKFSDPASAARFGFTAGETEFLTDGAYIHIRHADGTTERSTQDFGNTDLWSKTVA